jgi:hypothetical protein
MNMRLSRPQNPTTSLRIHAAFRGMITQDLGLFEFRYVPPTVSAASAALWSGFARKPAVDLIQSGKPVRGKKSRSKKI